MEPTRPRKPPQVGLEQEHTLEEGVACSCCHDRRGPDHDNACSDGDAGAADRQNEQLVVDVLTHTQI